MIKKTYTLIKSVLDRYNDHKAYALASHLTYSFLLALFPFLIFLISLISLTTFQSKEIVNEFINFFPIESKNAIILILENLIKTSNTKLLSISIVVALWSASSGIKAIILGLNKAYGIEECRSYIKKQLITMIYTLIFAVILIGMFVLLVFGKQLGLLIFSKFKLNVDFYYIWHIIRITGMILLLFITILIIYKQTTCAKVRNSDVFYGTLFTTSGWIIATFLFSLYVNNFSSYAGVYGSLAGIFIMIAWLNILSTILLYGGELNAVLYYRKNPEHEKLAAEIIIPGANIQKLDGD